MEDIAKASETSKEHPAQDRQDGRWTPTPEQLKRILSEHERWLDSGEKDGEPANLGKAILSMGDLHRARLTKARLEDADLRGANLHLAELQGARLDRAQLQKADLVGAQLQGADLHRAQLKKAKLRRAQLQGADLHRAQLQDANLHRAQLQGAILNEAHLQNATLCRANLQGAKLIEAQLQGAALNRAELRGANLSRAQLQGAALNRAKLRGASLVGADFEGQSADLSLAVTSEGFEKTETEEYTWANLSGCVLRDADLQDADLETVTGLQASAIGGAVTLRASLPAEIARFDALKTVGDISARARVLFLSLIAACLYSWLTIASTPDLALIRNTGSTPLPIIQTEVPIAWFFCVAPWILLALFLYLHLYLQRLWEALSSLPAVFPSGRRLDEEAYPWLLSSLVLAYVPNLADRSQEEGKDQEKEEDQDKEDQRPAFWWLQLGLSAVAGWILVPFTILGYWAGYLPRHDWFGTIAILVAFLIATVGAVVFWRHAAATLRDGHARSIRHQWEPELAMAVFATVNLLFATFIGVQPNERVQVLGARNYAYLKGAELKEHNLQNQDLRYAYLWGANLEEARLQNAELQGADLFGANLEKARLRGADLFGADLSSSNLEMAILERADLEQAILLNANGLKCEALTAAENWELAYRDEDLACGASIPVQPETP